MKKKILASVLSVAMILTMFSALSVIGASVSAANANIVHISDPEQLGTDYFKNFTEDTTVIIDNDLVLTSGFRFSAQTGITVTVQSKNPSTPATLTSTQWIASGCHDSNYAGNIIVKDLNIDIKSQYGLSIYNGANITLENVKITAKIPADQIKDYQGYCTVGIFNYYSDSSGTMPISVTMNNCIIDPGTVDAPVSGIEIYTNNVTLTLNNSIIKCGVNSNESPARSSSGIGLLISQNLTNVNVALNKSTVTGGNSEMSNGGDGVRAHSGNIVITDCAVISGDSNITNSGVAISIHDGNVIINGGTVIVGSNPTGSNNQFNKWNNGSKGTITINPTFVIKGNIATLSPAIAGIPISLNGSQTLVTDENGQITKATGNFVISDILTIPDSFQLKDSFVANCNVGSYRLSSQNTQITATATIPSPTFTVTIPEKIDFGAQTQALKKYENEAKDQFDKDVCVSVPIVVTATGVSNLFDDFESKAQLNITANFDKTLTGVKVDSKTISYVIKQNNAEIQSGAVIGAFYNDVDLQSKGLTENKLTVNAIINRSDIQNADSYTGTMTFTISQPTK